MTTVVVPQDSYLGFGSTAHPYNNAIFLVGTNGSAWVTGNNNVLVGTGDQAILSATGGNETIAGTDGNDYLDLDGWGQIYTGAGNDTIDLTPRGGAVSLFLGSGHDTIYLDPFGVRGIGPTPRVNIIGFTANTKIDLSEVVEEAQKGIVSITEKNLAGGKPSGVLDVKWTGDEFSSTASHDLTITGAGHDTLAHMLADGQLNLTAPNDYGKG